MRLTAKARSSRCRQRIAAVSVGNFTGASIIPEQAQRQAIEVAYDSADRPDPYVGPVEVVITPGRGRGLVVTSDMPAGTLLLLCHPLTLLTGTPGTSLTPSELVTHFERGPAQSHTQRQNTPQQQHQEGGNVSCEQKLQQTPGTWVSVEQSNILDSLFDGSQSSASAAPLSLNQLAAVRLSPSITTPPATSEEQRCYKLADGRLQRIIEFNCKGEDNGDQAAWLCRGEVQSAYIGLFPALALINHSCTPNASCCGLAGGRALAVRSSVDLSRGDEVLISYLGRYISSPPSTRQELLRYSYGFTCDCKRCTAEDKQSPLSDPELSEAWIRLDPFLREAAMQGLARGADPRPLRDLESRLLRLSLSVRASAVGFAAGLQPQDVDVNTPGAASVTQVQDSPAVLSREIASSQVLLKQADDFSSTASATVTASPISITRCIVEEQPASCAGIVNSGTVSIIKPDTSQVPVVLAPLDMLLLMAAPPGSYSHCALSMSHLSNLQATLGEEHPMTQQALTVAIDSHTARYGDTEPVVRARLMAAHQEGQTALEVVTLTSESGKDASLKPTSGFSAGLSVVAKWLRFKR